jgi:hypothetical protein
MPGLLLMVIKEWKNTMLKNTPNRKMLEAAPTFAMKIGSRGRTRRYFAPKSAVIKPFLPSKIKLILQNPR